MPRFVDHDVRKRDIVRATLEVLAESGTGGLSFRAVAARLGGSTTLVTHYFPNQDALLAEVASASLVLWGEARQFSTSSGPVAAAAVVASVVPVVLMLTFWRTVVRGLTTGSRP